MGGLAAAASVAMVATVAGMWLDEPARARAPLEDAVEVEAGATCLQTPRLVEQLGLWLERDHVDAAIEVEVRGDATDPWAASFVIVRDGTAAAPRTLHDIPRDCAALHAAVAVAIAVAVDASVLEDRLGVPASPPPAEPPPQREPEPEPELPPSPEPDVPAVPATPNVGVLARVAGSLAIGLADGPGYGGEAAVTLRLRPRIDLELGVATVVAPHGRLADGRVRAVLVRGDTRVCGRAEPTGAIIRGCVAAGFGALQLGGRRFDDARSTTVPWVGVGPSFDVTVPRDRIVAFTARADLWVPVIRTRVVGFGDAGEVAADKALPVAAAALSIGPTVRFR